jgi:hypothetical protein
MQYNQQNSDGAYWSPIDNTSITQLQLTITTTTATSYVIGANADLWTTVAGYNQDIGIMVSGGAYGPGTLVAWKESGGFAGTFSPNAGFVQTVLHLQASTTYKVWAVWKANTIATAANAIYIGAGPINTAFSPSWLIATQLSQP